MGQARSRSTRTTRRSRKPSKELARTWLVSVINPLVRSLEIEESFLRRRQWSWNASTETFEYIRFASDYVDSIFQPNFVAFKEWYAEARKRLDNHDRGVRELNADCREVYQKLLTNEAFLLAVQNADQMAAAQGLMLDSIRGGLPGPAWPSVLAQYLINNTESLPSNYSTSEYWNRCGAAIREVRTFPAFALDFAEAERAGSRLLKATERVIDGLKELRNSYVHDFGLPPVPLVESVERADPWRG